MTLPVQFVLENDTLYAIGSKGDKYEILLESHDREAFCACEGFKWSNTDAKRDTRPHRAVQDCRHLQTARERANAAHVSPRFRLYHPPSQTVCADKFRSIESMEFLLNPATTPIAFSLSAIEIQRFDEAKQEWIFVRLAGESLTNCVEMTPMVDKEASASEPPPRKSRKKEPPPDPPKEERPPSFYCRSCENISPAIEWIEDRCPKCQRTYDYKGTGHSAT